MTTRFYMEYIKKTPGLQFASELYRPSDRRLSAKLVPTLADMDCIIIYKLMFRINISEPY
jgi:hypothetical protein